MSAAEPADPAPPEMNTSGPGAVIDITKRRRGGALQAAQGRWTMETPPGPAPDDAGRTALERFAEDIEISLNEIHQSLTDEDTAAVFVRTLQICARALEGSRATGLIDQAQLEELLAVIHGMEQAPRLLA